VQKVIDHRCAALEPLRESELIQPAACSTAMLSRFDKSQNVKTTFPAASPDANICFTFSQLRD
jgi:hypothetical protein